jgi:BirA family biotin operon repressor/biotin-[acetyl-CoA-carboxylase] ligase
VVELSESTNDDARRDALAGAPDGHVVVADSQRSGRGSQGRSWVSPPGDDLYLSIVARPALELAQLPPLTLAVGLGVADAVERLLAPPRPKVEVKWPNDVRIADQKCAGVLVEASSVGNELGPVVIGVGLNVNRMHWPHELQGVATSLLAAQPDRGRFDRGIVLACVLAEVESWLDRFLAEGGAPLVAALEQRLALRGQRVRIGGIEGTLAGVAPSGAVRIATASGMRELVAGRLE